MREYVPKEVQAKLEAARRRGATVETERRVVTILFCDVKGSTAAAERLDPEEWAEIMNEVFGLLIGPVYRYEGVIARLMGDAILAFFGAPIAHEDDPQRATLAALEIVEGIRAERDRLRREHGLALDVRVGINTGLVVVGEVGSDLRVEYTAMGDAVNLAARMEQTAAPGTVRITEETRRLVGPLFDFEPLGDVEVRGKTEPVHAFRVLSRKAEPGTLRGIAGREAPLVGRDRELAALRGAVAALRQGRGGVVSLVGEPGLGKTRLLAELRREAAGVRWLECRGISYDTTRPYGLFQQLIRQMCAIDERDAPDVARAKIDRTVGGAERMRRAYEILLGVEREPESAALAGEALKREIQEAMSETVRRGASQAPALLVCDDLHWADPASIELILHLLPLARETRYLTILAFRPDPDAPSARARDEAAKRYAERYTEVALAPLTPEESRTLVDHLLADLPLASEGRERILRKAEGNPFFVEEVARVVLEHGDVADLAIPDTLGSLLVARIDRLAEEPRRALQRASVIGRTFQQRVLGEISDDGHELDAQLATLERADLVREERAAAERSWLFKHALTRDAAYATISLKRRRELHRRVGEALERLFGDRRDEIAALLGHHFYEALDPRAVRYERIAGDEAYRLYANVEAAAHYARALERGDRTAAATGDLSHLYLRRGRALELTGRQRDALAAYEEMEQVARERGDRRLELDALLARAALRSFLNPVFDPNDVESAAERALAIAGELGDRAAEARVLWARMLLGSMGARDPAESVAFGERSLAIARELALSEQIAFTQHDMYHLRMLTGDLAEGRRLLDESRPLWRDLDNRPMLADNLGSSAICAYLAGRYDEALAFADEAFAISTAINNVWNQSYSRGFVGHVLFDRGEPARALEEIEAALRRADEAGLTPARAVLGSDAAWFYAELGGQERAFAHAELSLAAAEGMSRFHAPIRAIRARLELRSGRVEEAARLVERLEVGWNVHDLVGRTGVYVPWAQADVALALGDLSRALDSADRALAHVRASGARTHLAPTLLLRARVLRALGREAEALEHLLEARRAAEDLGSRWNLWRVLAALGETDRARALARDVADHAGSLRESFLASWEVVSLLESGA